MSNDKSTRSKWVTYDELDTLNEESKASRTYYHDKSEKGKHREASIKLKNQIKDKDLIRISIQKPQPTYKDSFFKCTYCNMILFNNRDIQGHSTHSKTFSKNFFKPTSHSPQQTKYSKDSGCS